MIKTLLVALVVIVPVALLSAGLVLWRSEALLEEKEPKIGNAPAPEPKVFSFAVLAFGIIAGLLITVLLNWMSGRWPETGATNFSWISTGAAVMLSVAVVFVRPLANMGGIPECIALHALWGIGYGWILPAVVNGAA
jgi:hypothetical protein